MDPTKNASSNRLLFGILSYLGPLVIISFLVKKDDAFVKFHVKQGFVLLFIEIVAWVLFASMMYSLWPLYQVIHLALIVLSIIGIINVIQNNEKKLPVVGDLDRYVTI